MSTQCDTCGEPFNTGGVCVNQRCYGKRSDIGSFIQAPIQPPRCPDCLALAKALRSNVGTGPGAHIMLAWLNTFIAEREP